jgi:WD40 repeat protein
MPSLSSFLNLSQRLAPKWRISIEDHVAAVEWSRGDKFAKAPLLAAASISGPIVIFNEAGDVVHRLKGHGFGTAALAWSPDGTVLASAGQDGKVRLWNPETGEEIAALAGGASWVESLAWSPRYEGRPSILASAAGKSLRFWQADGTLISEHTKHTSTIADLAWHPKKKALATACYGLVTTWEPGKDVPTEVYSWKGSHLKLAWSPDGRYVVTGDQDATVHFWVIRTGEDLQMYGYPTKVRELSWDASSRFLATGGGPVVTIWDFAGSGPAGSTPITLPGHRDAISVLAYQPRGVLLASGGQDGMVFLWKHPSKPQKEVAPTGMVSFSSGVSALNWSPNEKMIAVGTEDGDVSVLILT